MLVNLYNPWTITIPLCARDNRHVSNAISTTQLNKMALNVSPYLRPLWIGNLELPFADAF